MVVVGTTTVDEIAVVLDTIMYGDDVTERILKVCAHLALDQSKQRCFLQTTDTIIDSIKLPSFEGVASARGLKTKLPFAATAAHKTMVAATQKQSTSYEGTRLMQL